MKKIVAYIIKPAEDNQIEIIASDGYTCKGNDISQLIQCFSSLGEVLNVAWSLDASVASLLTLLPERKLLKLHSTNRCYSPPFNIFYVAGKVFSCRAVTSLAPLINLYGLDQYFPDAPVPETLAETKQYGEKLLEALGTMNLEANKLTSPVSIYENCTMQYMNLPTVYDMPKEVALFALECSGKLWTEAYKIGYWNEAYDYDIDSSFPDVIKGLIDIRYGRWHRTNTLYRTAYYSFFKCRVTIFDNVIVSPIIFTDKDGNLSTPTGTWNTYLTSKEIQFIYKYNIGRVDIEDGYVFIPDRIMYPFKQQMEDLLEYKNNSNPLVRDLAKRMSVGVYGKFGEEYSDRFGNYFNPVWFAEISTNVRLEVARFIYDNKLHNDLIHISVDGVLLSNEVQ